MRLRSQRGDSPSQAAAKLALASVPFQFELPLQGVSPDPNAVVVSARVEAPPTAVAAYIAPAPPPPQPGPDEEFLAKLKAATDEARTLRVEVNRLRNTAKQNDDKAKSDMVRKNMALSTAGAEIGTVRREAAQMQLRLDAALASAASSAAALIAAAALMVSGNTAAAAAAAAAAAETAAAASAAAAASIAPSSASLSSQKLVKRFVEVSVQTVAMTSESQAPHKKGAGGAKARAGKGGEERGSEGSLPEPISPQPPAGGKAGHAEGEAVESGPVKAAPKVSLESESGGSILMALQFDSCYNALMLCAYGL